MKNFIFVALSFLSCLAHAYTDCTVTIDKIYAGDGGVIYISYEGGGSVVVLNNSDQKNALSLAMSAFAMNKRVAVRYNSNNVSCTTNLVNDFAGLSILKN